MTTHRFTPPLSLRRALLSALLLLVVAPLATATAGTLQVGQPGTPQIAAGGYHTCALLADGTVQCWGADSDGQLGNGGPNTSSPTPVSVTGISTATAIAAGNYHTCALLASGAVQCWGDDSDGQLGNGGSNTDSPTPVSVSGISTATAIAANGWHTCALLADGSVQCWGYDFYGQLGNGGLNTDSPTPVPVTGISTATAIAAGGYHTCALLATGSMQCWGYGFHGQLGDGKSANSPTPVSVTGISTATALAAGGFHTCALLADGSVQCWGYDLFGQLGNGGSNTDSPTPVAVTGSSTASAIAAGGYHTCARLATGSVQCWGRDNNGQLGNGGLNTDSPTPVSVTGISTATAIAAGGYHTCALLATGSVQCWGDDSSGQLGNGAPLTASPTPVPTRLVQPFGVTALAAGANHTCALLGNGSVQCWGSDGNGQLGNGAPTTSSPTPVTVTGISTATAIAAGGYHTCALLATGSVQCWGNGDYGQIGQEGGSSTPVPVTGISTATAIAAGGLHTCALLASGSVQCWGYGNSGQLGDGNNNTSSTPVSVAGLEGIATAIAAGANHTCALLAIGTVLCWGFGDYGQLGDGNNNSSSTPVSVFGLEGDATGIAAGGNHTCARLADGTVRCWGFGEYGQLGDGGGSSYNPVFVDGLDGDATAIAAGGNHTCALLADGSVRCWGNGEYGQLGNNDNGNSYTPVPVYDFFNATAIAAGANHTCARLANGTVQCWGYGDSGQLGDGGGSGSSSTPVGVRLFRVSLPLLTRDYVAMFPGPNEREPNNSYQQANGALISGVTYTPLHNDDKDYFSIYLRTSGTITVTVTTPNASSQLQLFQGPPGSPVRSDTTSSDGGLSVTYNGSPGWYYIYIFTESPNSSNTYNLRTTYP